MADITTDVLIVGGSFAGIAAGLQLVRARRATLVVDGGEPRNRFAQKSHGFFAHDGEEPCSMLQQAKDQFLMYPAASWEEGAVISAKPITDTTRFLATLKDGRTVDARRLMLAYGVRDELPEVPGMEEFWGTGIIHCPYCHAYEFADRRLGVLGSCELAIGRALLLCDWSCDVTLYTNGPLECSDEERVKLESRGIVVVEDTLKCLLGKDGVLSSIVLDSGEERAIDALLTSTWAVPSSDLADQLGCKTEETPSGFSIVVDEHQSTTVLGVYAAGDVARARHSISLAVADGAAAGAFCHHSLVAEDVQEASETRRVTK